jgi:hypothetical protein
VHAKSPSEDLLYPGSGRWGVICTPAMSTLILRTWVIEVSVTTVHVLNKICMKKRHYLRTPVEENRAGICPNRPQCPAGGPRRLGELQVT